MLLIMPIICANHWTLLVVQRQEAVPNLDEEPEPKMAKNEPHVTGCPKCTGAGCKDCDPAIAAK